jgi:hypothetical protein
MTFRDQSHREKIFSVALLFFFPRLDIKNFRYLAQLALPLSRNSFQWLARNVSLLFISLYLLPVLGLSRFKHSIQSIRIGEALGVSILLSGHLLLANLQEMGLRKFFCSPEIQHVVAPVHSGLLSS